MPELLRINAAGVRAAEAAPFSNETQDLQGFLKAHLGLLGPTLKLIAEQLDTGLADRLDMLAIEQQPNGEYLAVVVELKNVRATKEVLLQCLRYAKWLRGNPDSVRLYASQARVGNFQLDSSAIKIVLVAPDFEPEMLELAAYLSSGVEFSFVEFHRFRITDDQYIVLERRGASFSDPASPSSKQEEWTWSRYETVLGCKPEATAVGRKVFAQLEGLSASKGWGLTPVFRKWYVPFQINGWNAASVSFRSQKTVALEVHLPASPELLGLPALPPDAKWDSATKWLRVHMKTGDESLEAYVPYMQRSVDSAH